MAVSCLGQGPCSGTLHFRIYSIPPHRPVARGSHVVKIAYLLSQFPAVNHVFMLREVRLLRSLGFDIRVASIRPPDRPPRDMTQAEQEEAQSTYCVKQTPFADLVWAHIG